MSTDPDGKMSTHPDSKKVTYSNTLNADGKPGLQPDGDRRSSAMIGYSDDEGPIIQPLMILWQDGPVAEVGINGVQIADVLAAVRQRQAHLVEHFPTIEKLATLTAIDTAIECDAARTKQRQAAGVEGTSAPEVSG